MRIAIVGAGHVGGTLGTAWPARGHAVVSGVRGPNAPRTNAPVQRAGSRARAGGPGEAVAAGEVAVLARPRGATEEVVRAIGDWRGRLLVDATNPSTADASDLALGHTTYGGEAAAKTMVSGLARDLGFDPVDAGPLRQARPLAPRAMPWVSMPLACGHGPGIAFRLLREPTERGR